MINENLENKISIEMLQRFTKPNITNKFINNIIYQLEIKGINDGISITEQETVNWWKENRELLVGLSISEVATILRNARNRKNLAKQYDVIVASMSWNERIEFLQKGIDELKYSNSNKIRQAVLIARVVEIGIKLLPILLAAL